MSTKDTNPKDAVGTKKWRQYCTVPTTIIWELGVAMLEGARKYGRHNYRVAGVRASVYIDAAKGHIDQWWEGEDIDAESGLSHITKAMASLAVLRDAMINDMVTDDRPPKCNLNRVRDEMQKAVEGIFERFPDAVEPFTELGERPCDILKSFTEMAKESANEENKYLEARLADPDDSTVRREASMTDDFSKGDMPALSSDSGYRLDEEDIPPPNKYGPKFDAVQDALEKSREDQRDSKSQIIASADMERRLADPDDDTVLTKTKARDSSVGFDDYCKDTAAKEDRSGDVLAGVDGHKDGLYTGNKY